MSKKELLTRFKAVGVIHHEPVTLRSGEIANFYCDLKRASGYPDILVGLADMVGALLPADCTCLAASGYGGLPLAAVVATRFDKKFIAVRDTIKTHGKGGRVDGYIPTTDDVVVIIDDVLTTGNSIKTTLSGLESIGIRAVSVIVVVKRKDAELPIPYQWVFEIEELTKSNQ